MIQDPEQVSTGCLSWSSVLWQTRSTLIHLRGGSVLFDPTYFPAEIERIVVESRNFSPDGEDILVFTHSDWDHIVGASAFPERRCVAHRAVLQKNEADRLRIVDEIRSSDSTWHVERDTAPVYPRIDLTVESEESLDLAGEPCLVIPAMGHTMTESRPSFRAFIFWWREIYCRLSSSPSSTTRRPLIDGRFTESARWFASSTYAC